MKTEPRAPTPNREPVLPAWVRPARPPRAFTFGAVVIAGFAFDFAIRSDPEGFGSVVFFALLGVVMFAEAKRPQPRALAFLAVVFGAWLGLRASEWLSPLNILAAGGLLVGAASLERGGSVFDLSGPRLFLRGVHAVVNGLLGPFHLLSGRATDRRMSAVVRGLAIAIPLAVLVGVLLASGDAVFASAFRFDIGDIVLRVVLVAIGTCIACGLARIAATPLIEATDTRRLKLGSVEWTIVLVVLDLVYAGFAVARVVALSEGGRRVLKTEGLTYAEYARSGFFQLLAAAGITLGALLVLRGLADTSDPRGRRRFLFLGEAAVALTLVAVVSAFQRLLLYERAFGLSMLRLYSLVFCMWLGLALTGLAVWMFGIGGRRDWFFSAVAAVALALLLALNIANPEAIVVQRNVERTARTDRFDAEYLSLLSADAVPAMVDSLDRLDEDTREDVTSILCEWPGSASGWAAWNASERRARLSLESICQPTSP